MPSVLLAVALSTQVATVSIEDVSKRMRERIMLATPKLIEWKSCARSKVSRWSTQKETAVDLATMAVRSCVESRAAYREMVFAALDEAGGDSFAHSKTNELVGKMEDDLIRDVSEYVLDQRSGKSR